MLLNYEAKKLDVFQTHKPQLLNIGASEFCIKYKNILEVLCLRYMLDQGSVNFL